MGNDSDVFLSQFPKELRILVVDDEPDVLLGLRMLVESMGVQVRTASCGHEALERMPEWEPHLVLSDITMEEMNGLELLDAVKRHHPNVKVILITGYGTIELAVSSLQRGAVHFITKPFDNEEIRFAVCRYGQEALVEQQVRRMKVPTDDGQVIIAQDPRMRTVLELAEQAALTTMTVLIQGASGTGKELIARAIHKRSSARDRPFLAVNSAALPDTLLEAELFGHTKGAFTGADSERAGIFEQAAGGAVFLDEIGLMSPQFQSKLLRVLEEKIVVPIGTTQARPVEFRLITALNGNLHDLVDQGKFREELYYRLRVVTIDLPLLRERPGDISALAAYFLAKYAAQVTSIHPDPPRISADAIQEMQGHGWPGNVRELENCIQRALVLCRGEEICVHHLGLNDDESAWTGTLAGNLSYEEGKRKVMERFQRLFIERALAHAEGNITRAAKACRLTRAAFQRIMRSLNISRNSFLKQ